MSETDAPPAAAAAASTGSVADKKSRRRGARSSTARPHRWHMSVDDLLKRSPKLVHIQTVNGEASAFSSSAMKLFFIDVLAPRTDAVRAHRGCSTFKHQDVANAVRSLYAFSTPAVRSEVEDMLIDAEAAVEAVHGSRPPKKEKSAEVLRAENGPSDEE